MIEYFLAPGSIPFTAALLVMAGLLVFEIVALLGGLGLNELVDDLVVSNVDLPDDLGDSAIPATPSYRPASTAAPHPKASACSVACWPGCMLARSRY